MRDLAPVTAAVTLLSVSLVLGCSAQDVPPPTPSSAEMLDGLVARWTEAGRQMRPCEVDQEAKDCQFAVRDALAATNGTMDTLIQMGVPKKELGLLYTITGSMVSFERDCFPTVGYTPDPDSHLSSCVLTPAGEWIGEMGVKELNRIRPAVPQ